MSSPRVAFALAHGPDGNFWIFYPEVTRIKLASFWPKSSVINLRRGFFTKVGTLEVLEVLESLQIAL